MCRTPSRSLVSLPLVLAGALVLSGAASAQVPVFHEVGEFLRLAPRDGGHGDSHTAGRERVQWSFSLAYGEDDDGQAWSRMSRPRRWQAPARAWGPAVRQVAPSSSSAEPTSRDPANLLDLLLRLVELRAEVELMEPVVASAQSLFEAGRKPQSELLELKTRFEVARRKLEVAEAVAQAQVEQTERELAHARKRADRRAALEKQGVTHPEENAATQLAVETLTSRLALLKRFVN